MKVTKNIHIGEEELREEFTRSSGPGGQHVNKTSTAVQLRYDAARSPSLPEDVRQRVLKQAGSHLTSGGELLVESRKYRSQDRNRHEARRRLAELIRKAAQPPKKRKKTKPTRASKERRLKEKKQRGDVKKMRKPIRRDE